MLSKNIFGEDAAGGICAAAGAGDSALEPFHDETGLCTGLWWRRILSIGRRPARRLRLCESLALGDRRFVAVIEFEQSRFLVGGTSTSLVLLARLNQGELSAELLPRAEKQMSGTPLSSEQLSTEDEL